MLKSISDTLAPLHGTPVAQALRHLQCGIEKEGLRLDHKGRIALTDHPQALGSALTHGSITTDYSEALQEFITPVFSQPEAAISHMQQLHSFNARVLADQQEYLWPASMPGYLAGEDDIRIAEYGRSNTGKLKHIYRVGLAWRYGKIMQCIAGMHYNFSPQEDFWQAYQAYLGDTGCPKEFHSSHYFALIRNFRRHSWLLLYLFGASPALDASFVGGRDVGLQAGPGDSLIGPYATSLRMSDLGYNNNVQSTLNVCFNDLPSYAKSLAHAITTPLDQYEKIGVKVAGVYRQLNANLLQIENEFYSDIRPKRVARAGQKPVHALFEGGVEYVEVRNLDLNPFLPLGMDAQQGHFINVFLVWCLLKDSPIIADQECDWIIDNQAKMVREGRRPDLMLHSARGQISMHTWGTEILAELREVALLMPDPQACISAINTLAERLADSSLTPSAQVLSAMQEGGMSYQQLIMQLAQQHQQYHLQQPLPADTLRQMQVDAQQSWLDQAQLEAEQTDTFDDFLAAYLAQ
ncbi:MAG: glutamate--cysteine ligase [Gammaproteobacteria bacterium]|nr:glutamate--cysteine ligase [Gammaproteobacteria bacterium]